MVMSVVGAAVVVGAAATTTGAAVTRGIAVKSGVDGTAGVGIEIGPAKATEARARGKAMKRPRILVVYFGLVGKWFGLTWWWCGKLLWSRLCFRRW